MSSQSGDSNAGARLREIYEREWAWREAEFGPQVSSAVVCGFLPDVSIEAQGRRESRWRGVLRQLDDIDQDALDRGESVDYRVYRNQIETLLVSQEMRMYERPATSDSAFWRSLSFEGYRLALPDTAAASAYLARLSEIPRYFAQHVANMEAGVARGFAPPAVCMVGSDEPLRAVAECADVTELPFFRPFGTLPRSVAAGERDALVSAARSVLENTVVPAYRELYAFVRNEYLPRLPTAIAALDQPNGPQFYAAQLREYSTLNLSPEEIFRIGNSEVERLMAEFDRVAVEVGWTGNVRGLFEYMRTESQFYATSPRALLAEAAYTCKAFDGVVHRYFGRLPVQRFSIMATPPEIEVFDTAGRGSSDRYLVNTYDLPSRPLYSLPALTLHEAAPGHAFQLSLADELDLPEFRRIYISAFGEGWALYCERLGDEMGMYETTFERLGMLSFQLWRAARLVVDPGIHAFGWSRERAQDFLRDHTAIAEHEIVTEIDRYISWPGQAVAYALGQQTIERLRTEAETALDGDFDIRAFHDAVLGLGNVPLAVLESEIRAFIADRLARA